MDVELLYENFKVMTIISNIWAAIVTIYVKSRVALTDLPAGTQVKLDGGGPSRVTKYALSTQFCFKTANRTRLGSLQYAFSNDQTVCKNCNTVDINTEQEERNKLSVSQLHAREETIAFLPRKEMRKIWREKKWICKQTGCEPFGVAFKSHAQCHWEFYCILWKLAIYFFMHTSGTSQLLRYKFICMYASQILSRF